MNWGWKGVWPYFLARSSRFSVFWRGNSVFGEDTLKRELRTCVPPPKNIATPLEGSGVIRLRAERRCHRRLCTGSAAAEHRRDADATRVRRGGRRGGGGLR